MKFQRFSVRKPCRADRGHSESVKIKKFSVCQVLNKQ